MGIVQYSYLSCKEVGQAALSVTETAVCAALGDPAERAQAGPGGPHLLLQIVDLSEMKRFHPLKGCHGHLFAFLQQGGSFWLSWAPFAGAGLQGLSLRCRWALCPSKAALCHPQKSPGWLCTHEESCGGLVFWLPGLNIALTCTNEPRGPRELNAADTFFFSDGKLGICGQSSASTLKSHSSRNVTLFTY